MFMRFYLEKKQYNDALLKTLTGTPENHQVVR
jgi:hypothetical protein